MNSTVRNRRVLLLSLVAVAGLATPASAQTTTGEFNYSPEAQQRGQSITITGKCINGGSTDNVDMIVTVQEGSNGEGSYGFSKAFLPTESGSISGTIEVPGDAPFGAYVIGGACRSGSTFFFSKNGPFAVVERAGATTTTASTTTTVPGATTTTVPGATTTTSTTIESATTTTYALGDTVPDTVDDDPDTTDTTIDEFAGTRNEDDDSIAPLLLVLGIIPLLAAIVAIVLAMRRRGGQPDAGV